MPLASEVACPKCWRLMEADAAECPWCSERLSKPERPAPTSAPALAPPAWREPRKRRVSEGQWWLVAVGLVLVGLVAVNSGAAWAYALYWVGGMGINILLIRLVWRGARAVVRSLGLLRRL